MVNIKEYVLCFTIYHLPPRRQYEMAYIIIQSDDSNKNKQIYRSLTCVWLSLFTSQYLSEVIEFFILMNIMIYSLYLWHTSSRVTLTNVIRIDTFKLNTTTHISFKRHTLIYLVISIFGYRILGLK